MIQQPKRHSDFFKSFSFTRGASEELGLRFGETDEMKKCEKEYLQSSTWHICFYVKSWCRSHQNCMLVCMHVFVLQTGIFYDANYFIKKVPDKINLTSLSVFITPQFTFKNKVLNKQWYK